MGHPNPQNLKVPTSEQARINGSKGGSSPKRKATLDAKKLMKTILSSKPVLNDKSKRSLMSLGIDVNDEKLTTNAALMIAVLTSKAVSGDMNAIKMALEMGGQPVDAKTLVEIEKLKLERDKFELERFMALRQVQPMQESVDVKDPFIGALEYRAKEITPEACDIPEDAPIAKEDAKDADK